MRFIDLAQRADILGEPYATVHGALTGLLTDGISGRVSHGTDEELQKTLFSWAELMAEPVKPKCRKAYAPSLSLFEWAVEREREAEPVGAGH